MDTYLDKSGEKAFLTIISKLLGELKENLRFTETTLQDAASIYQNLSENEQKRCLDIIYDTLSDDYNVVMYLMSILLRKLLDKKIVFCIVDILHSKKYPLWARINDKVQLDIFLFTNRILQEYEGYQSFKSLYQDLLEEIKAEIQDCHPYIPYQARNKSIMIVMSMIGDIEHAPTKRLKVIYEHYENAGYQVECCVCYFKGTEGSWEWYVRLQRLNFITETSPFEHMLDGVRICGYNLTLSSHNYSEQIRQAVRLIWEKRPEFVLEIGSETILAGLCSSFTTVVTMGCTKKLPVTNAPIIATAVEHSKEEQQCWKQFLDDKQIVLEVKHTVNLLNTQDSKLVFTKEMFGIEKNAFVIIIAGNRLDIEVSEAFLDILYQILDKNDCFVIAVIGECPDLEKRIQGDGRGDRLFFLGTQLKFREAISIGDVFVNPPRQGGGTGGFFAIMEEVPVITLGNCDVEANSGQEFVCRSIEDMPDLVCRYFEDEEFMKAQKENCRKEAAARANINNDESFQKLCDTVKDYALKREEDI